MDPSRTRVRSQHPGSAGPVTLAVTEHGSRDAAVHVLLLHGYPDDQTLWDGVVALLPSDWHVVTLDHRGAGGSDHPAGVAAYHVDALAADVVTVLEATVPDGRPVHLVGHDWGAFVGWEVLTAATRDPRLERRLASYTSVSGICLDHLRSLASTRAGRRRLLPQAVHSWYVLLFAAPYLPELLWRRGQVLLRALARRIDPSSVLLPWGPGLVEDAVAGLGLYRSLLRTRRRPAAWKTPVPVLVVQPRLDGFITPRVDHDLEERCPDLRRVSVDCGHWVPRAEPSQLARLVREHVTNATSRSLTRHVPVHRAYPAPHHRRPAGHHARRGQPVAAADVERGQRARRSAGR